MHPLSACLLLTLTAPVLAQGSLLNHKTREALVKTDASREAAVEMGKKLDRYVEILDAFYAPFHLRQKNDNRIVARLMATRAEFEEYWRRRHPGSPPAAFFSPSLNALVLPNAPEDPNLRAVLFHETSHQYLNRYTYEAPKWFNEGLAEYLEGWSIPDQGDAEPRPTLFDLILVQGALREGKYLPLRTLVEMGDEKFGEFDKSFPDLHPYMHYATAWSLAYYCLTGPSEEDRQRWITFLQQLNDRGAQAQFAEGWSDDDWAAFEQRWREFILSLRPERHDVDDYLIVASAYRDNAEWAKAMAEYRALVKAFPDAEPKVLFEMGQCYAHAGYFDKARELLEKAREADADDPRPSFYLARLAISEGAGGEGEAVSPEAATEAVTFAREAAERSPEPFYSRFLADRLADAGEWKEAMEILTKLMRQADRDEREEYVARLKEMRERAREAKH